MFSRWEKMVQAEKDRQRQQKNVQKTCTKSGKKVKKPGKIRE